MLDIIMRHFLPNFVLVCSMIYIWHSFMNKKIDFKSPRLYITIIGVMCTSIANYILVNNFIRIVVLMIFFVFFFKFLFRENLQVSLITPVLYQVIIVISESIYAIILAVLKVDVNLTLTSVVFSSISNIIIAVISIIISKTKIVKKIHKKILSFTDKINSFQLLLFFLFAMLVENILLMSSYYKIDFQYLLFFNILLILICFVIVVYSLNTKNRYNKVSDKYNVVIKSLNNYETMMTKYRIANHENKNLLLTIRAMILNKEKDIPKYIDSMVENKYKDDEKLFFDMSVIPSGGLRATIYSEVMKIIDNKINYNLYIDKKIKTVDLIEMDTNTIIDICKIIGVFIDNAIDDVKGNENKSIQIFLYIENKELNIKVSNNFKNKIDISKIEDEGYTTKGKNRGYGLSLVGNIVKNNNDLSHKTEINKDLFSQIISIKYKKSR